jgi:hypothetical protein
MFSNCSCGREGTADGRKASDLPTKRGRAAGRVFLYKRARTHFIVVVFVVEKYRVTACDVDVLKHIYIYIYI